MSPVRFWPSAPSFAPRVRLRGFLRPAGARRAAHARRYRIPVAGYRMPDAECGWGLCPRYRPRRGQPQCGRGCHAPIRPIGLIRQTDPSTCNQPSTGLQMVQLSVCTLQFALCISQFAVLIPQSTPTTDNESLIASAPGPESPSATRGVWDVPPGIISSTTNDANGREDRESPHAKAQSPPNHLQRAANRP